MRKLLLGLGLVATVLAVRRSSGAGDSGDSGDTEKLSRVQRGGEIDLTAGAAPRSTRGVQRGVQDDEHGQRGEGDHTMGKSEHGQTDSAPGNGGHGDDEQGGRGHQADSPTEIPKAGWKDIAKRTLAEVKADRVPMMAAAVAFAGLLVLFPAMIAGISIYGLVADPQTASAHAADLTAALPPDAASLIGGQLETITSGEPATLGVALIVSVLAALWSASGGMSMLLDALNVAYDEEDERGFVKKRGLAILMTLGALVFVVVTVTLIAVVPPVLDNLGLGIVGTIAAQAARWVLLAALIAVALAVLYRFGPDRQDAKWTWISPGAVVAGALWLIGSLAFSFFVSNFGSYNETYGTVSGVIVLMLWLQISALVVLLGAEMNAETERQTVQDTTTGSPSPLGQRGAQPADDTPPPPGEDAVEEDRQASRT